MVQRRMVLVINFFECFKLVVCFVVAIFNLVHNVEAIYPLLNCLQHVEIFSGI